MQLPTVKIKYPANKRAGYAIINESDFDPKRHDLFDAPAKDDDQGGGDQPKSMVEVLALAEAEGVHFSTFKAEAAKLLGDKMPEEGTKANIIEALKAMPDGE